MNFVSGFYCEHAVLPPWILYFAQWVSRGSRVSSFFLLLLRSLHGPLWDGGLSGTTGVHVCCDIRYSSRLDFKVMYRFLYFAQRMVNMGSRISSFFFSFYGHYLAHCGMVIFQEPQGYMYTVTLDILHYWILK